MHTKFRSRIAVNNNIRSKLCTACFEFMPACTHLYCVLGKTKLRTSELFSWTKSNFWFSTIRQKKSHHNVRDPDSVPPVYSLLPILLLRFFAVLEYCIKNHIVIDRSHRTTGPWSDLRPDSWSWANSGLDTTSRIFETEKFWVKTRSYWANA